MGMLCNSELQTIIINTQGAIWLWINNKSISRWSQRYIETYHIL